jgi:hypothetical protein
MIGIGSLSIKELKVVLENKDGLLNSSPSAL